MIRILLDLYIFLLVGSSILSFFPQYRYKEWAIYLKKASDFTCKPIQRYLPNDLPFDFSPLIAIMGIQFIKLLW